MTVAIIVLAVSLAGAGATAIAIALRMSGVKDERKDAQVAQHEAELARQRAEHQLHETAREFNEYRQRTLAQLEALRADIQELEDDLSKCTTPGATRARLERLLSKASARGAGGGAGVEGVPGERRPGTADPGAPEPVWLRPDRPK